MLNGTISELYTDDKKSKYSVNSNDVLKSVKNFYEKPKVQQWQFWILSIWYKPNRQPTKLPLLNVLAKFLIERKCQINNFTHCEANISLEKVIKSIILKHITNLQVIMA